MLIYFFLPKSLNLFSTIYFHILNSRLIIKLKFLVLLFIKKQKNIPCFARIRIRNYIFIKKRKENYSQFCQDREFLFVYLRGVLSFVSGSNTQQRRINHNGLVHSLSQNLQQQRNHWRLHVSTFSPLNESFYLETLFTPLIFDIDTHKSNFTTSFY